MRPVAKNSPGPPLGEVHYQRKDEKMIVESRPFTYKNCGVDEVSPQMLWRASKASAEPKSAAFRSEGMISNARDT